MSPIVLQSLDKLALQPEISRITLERLKALARVSREYNVELISVARSLSHAFETAGVSALFAEDIAFAHAHYPVVELRPIERVECLVKESEWSRITSACEEIGFNRYPRAPEFESGSEALAYFQYYASCVLRNDRGNVIQLRFRLFDFGRPGAEETAWDRAKEMTVGEDGLRRLGDEDLLIQSCIRYNMSSLGRLLHAIDIAGLLIRPGDGLDWGYIESRLRSRSLYPSFYYTLTQVVQWLRLGNLGVQMSNPGPLRKKMFDMLWRPGRFAPGAYHHVRFYLLESDRPVDKIRLIARLVSPPRKWVAAFYGRPYNVWLRLKFILLVFRRRIGVGLS